MGTMLVGDQQRRTRFSCRLSNPPRLLYAIKRLNSDENKLSSRIHIIRVRQFGRKIVQPVFDSKIASYFNQTNMALTLPDLFLLKGDYLLIECENRSQSNCYFMIYYIYKSNSIQTDDICRDDSFSNLFKLIPSRDVPSTNQTIPNFVRIDGSTIFLIICMLLLVTWISIIVGCIIMRRIRGLVNFRTEPTSPSSLQKSRLLTGRVRATNDNCHRTGETDQVMQIDADHGG